MKTCPHCNRNVIFKKSFAHNRAIDVQRKFKTEIIIFKGWCAHCQIELRKKVEGSNESKWYTATLDLDDISPAISEDEIQQIDRKLGRYIKKHYRWKTFLSYRKTNDTLHRLVFPNGIQKSIAIVRNKMIIAEYSVFIEL
jgi:hypothetical protein